METFIHIQRKFVDVLLKIPGMDSYSMRSSLLQGLPSPSLVRDQTIPRLDLNNIISGLQQLGRLDDQGGTRPLILVTDNALQYVSEGGEVANTLHEVKEALTAYYGGDVQPDLQPLPPGQQEALIFGLERDNRLPVRFIERALLASKSIARLSVPRIMSGKPVPGRSYGTGWLIAPGLLITNHHVIEGRDRRREGPAQRKDFEAQAGQIEAWFDFHDKENGTALSCQGASLKVDNEQLDYAILQLSEAKKVANRVPFRIAPQPSPLERGSRLNIAQHSGGGPLQYAIRNNFFVQIGRTPEFIRYQTDTEGGASGSPVCNDAWQVIALHHASQPVPPSQVPQEVIDGNPVKVTVLNEAITLHAILNDLPVKLKQQILTAQSLLR
jgi:Trypsin-like peptidase domain